jgi:hypothetical protein
MRDHGRLPFVGQIIGPAVFGVANGDDEAPRICPCPMMSSMRLPMPSPPCWSKS